MGTRRLLLTLLLVLMAAGCAAPERLPDSGPSDGSDDGSTDTPASTDADAQAPASDGYVAPLFEAEESVAAAAGAGDFVQVNPLEYENPWR